MQLLKYLQKYFLKKMFRVRDAQIYELVVKSDGVNETIK